ncbi:unnamed protein product [Rhizophagus irregularis]|nr:unnamed protein product [Rhizophagus irregularis]CAB4426524.1 unnamed protein product [Rhizophagus irregularis]
MDETMRNIRMKNEVLKNYIIEEERDKNYNKRIDMIDEILKENQNFIDILSTKKDVLLGIDEKVRRCLENFMKNLSNRKRIDEDYYLEMLAIEKFLQDEDMKLDILGHSELENILEEKREMGKFLL